MSGAVADELAIRRLLAEYCHRCDDGDLVGTAALFSERGTFSFAGEDHSGRASIAAFLDRSQPPHRRGRHLTTNSVITIDGDVARALSDFVFLRPHRGGGLSIAMAGRYRDELRCDGGLWRFEHRAVELFGPAGLGPD